MSDAVRDLDRLTRTGELEAAKELVLWNVVHTFHNRLGLGPWLEVVMATWLAAAETREPAALRASSGIAEEVARALAGDGPVLALLILTGLNAVDELARTSFCVVAPAVADHFDVGLAGVTLPFVLAFAVSLSGLGLGASLVREPVEPDERDCRAVLTLWLYVAGCVAAAALVLASILGPARPEAWLLACGAVVNLGFCQ